MKIIIFILFKFIFFRELSGRYISIDNPELGRYSKRQLKEILNYIRITQNDLVEKAKLSQYKSHGNQLMVYCGILSLASYRVFRNQGMSHEYSTLLIGDVIWKLYIFGFKTIWITTGFITRSSYERLNYTLRILCKYPFNEDPKGYQVSVYSTSDYISTDFTQCVVQKYFSHVSTDKEMDFFRNSWCQYDFSLPSYLIDGGSYERKHTISNGDNICDMRWYAKPKVSGKKSNE